MTWFPLRAIQQQLAALLNQGTQIMALLDDIMAKETKLGQDFNTFATTVQGQLATANATIASLQAQLAAGSPVTQADLQKIADGLDAIDATVVAAGAPPVAQTQPPVAGA